MSPARDVVAPSIAPPEVPRTQWDVPLDTWPQVPAPAAPPHNQRLHTLIARSRLITRITIATLAPIRGQIS
jgi:hypothetical protein